MYRIYMSSNVVKIYNLYNQQTSSSKIPNHSPNFQRSPSFPSFPPFRRAQQHVILQKRQQLQHLLGLPQQDPRGTLQHLAELVRLKVLRPFSGWWFNGI